MKKRIFYIISFLVIFCIEVFIALYVRDSFVRPYMGDALVVVLVYSFVRIFIPTGVPRLPFYVFLFACFVEVLQYFQLVETLGITNRALRIILGSTFDWKDIVCYGVGCILSFCLSKYSDAVNWNNRLSCLAIAYCTFSLSSFFEVGFRSCPQYLQNCALSS